MNASQQTKRTCDPSPYGTKKKGKKDSEVEPMVLLPADPGESVTKYSLALSSASKDRSFDEIEMLRNITKNLHEIVNKMETVYAKEDEIIQPEEEEEEESTGYFDDMTSFLISCSQLRTQLESTLREEKQILESLFKWFEKEVLEMEEIGEEEMIPNWQIPLADKSVTDNINTLMDRIQRLEELNGRIQELPKLAQLSIVKQEKKKVPVVVTPTVAPVQKDAKALIEELASKHGTEDVLNMAQVFQDDSGQPQTIEMVNNRMMEVMKVFERQTNKLRRVANEQDVLEGKLQRIQREFQKISNEKELMEEELQKVKAFEKEKRVTDSRKKILSKLEKAKEKVEEKLPPSEKEEQEQKPVESESKKSQKEDKKIKDELVKAQENILSLEKEKKFLEDQLKKALEEVERAKIPFAEIPPPVPDTFSTAEEEVPKKGKKAPKYKPKGEDIRQVPVSVPESDKMERLSLKKSGEVGKSLHKTSVSSMEKLSKQASQRDILGKKIEEPKKGKAEMVEFKGVSKSKDHSEMKSKRLKGS